VCFLFSLSLSLGIFWPAFFGFCGFPFLFPSERLFVVLVPPFLFFDRFPKELSPSPSDVSGEERFEGWLSFNCL